MGGVHFTNIGVKQVLTHALWHLPLIDCVSAICFTFLNN